MNEKNILNFKIFINIYFFNFMMILLIYLFISSDEKRMSKKVLKDIHITGGIKITVVY